MTEIATSISVGNEDEQLGWRPSIERLQRDYEAARAGGRADPWASVEAECWLDLIDAELSAPSTRPHPKLKTQLMQWRGQIALLLKKLRELEEKSSLRSKHPGTRSNRPSDDPGRHGLPYRAQLRDGVAQEPFPANRL